MSYIRVNYPEELQAEYERFLEIYPAILNRIGLDSAKTIFEEGTLMAFVIIDGAQTNGALGSDVEQEMSLSASEIRKILEANSDIEEALQAKENLESNRVAEIKSLYALRDAMAQSWVEQQNFTYEPRVSTSDVRFLKCSEGREAAFLVSESEYKSPSMLTNTGQKSHLRADHN